MPGLMHESVNFVTGGGGKSIAALGASALGVGGAAKAFTIVGPNEVGVRARRGDVVRSKGRYTGEPFGVVSSGLHFMWPLTHSIHKINTGDRSDGVENIINLEGQEDGAQLLIKSRLTWAIRRDGYNPIIALIKSATEGDIRESVVSTVQEGVNTVALETPRNILNDGRQMTGLVDEIVRDGLLEYGVSMHRLKILSVSETFGQMVREAGSNDIARMAGLAGSLESLHEKMADVIPLQSSTQAI